MKEPEHALDVLPIELWLKILKSTNDDDLGKSLTHPSTQLIGG